MPWPCLLKFFTGDPRPQPENSYLTYVRKRCLENHERYRRGVPDLPLLEREEWAQDNEQAVTDWHEQTVHRHNQVHKTKYRNWNDVSRARSDSAMKDRNARATTVGRTWNGHDEPLSFISEPHEQSNLGRETDQEYTARTIPPHGRSGMDYASSRSFHDRGSEDGRRATGGGANMRDSFLQDSKQGAAGWRSQGEHLNEGAHDPAATGNTSWEENSHQDEAEAFLNSFKEARATGGSGSSDDWSDEAEAFLKARP